jgi:hypothetical protein
MTSGEGRLPTLTRCRRSTRQRVKRRSSRRRGSVLCAGDNCRNRLHCSAASRHLGLQPIAWIVLYSQGPDGADADRHRVRRRLSGPLGGSRRPSNGNGDVMLDVGIASHWRCRRRGGDVDGRRRRRGRIRPGRGVAVAMIPAPGSEKTGGKQPARPDGPQQPAMVPEQA